MPSSRRPPQLPPEDHEFALHAPAPDRGTPPDLDLVPSTLLDTQDKTVHVRAISTRALADRAAGRVTAENVPWIRLLRVLPEMHADLAKEDWSKVSGERLVVSSYTRAAVLRAVIEARALARQIAEELEIPSRADDGEFLYTVFNARTFGHPSAHPGVLATWSAVFSGAGADEEIKRRAFECGVDSRPTHRSVGVMASLMYFYLYLKERGGTPAEILQATPGLDLALAGMASFFQKYLNDGDDMANAMYPFLYSGYFESTDSPINPYWVLAKALDGDLNSLPDRIEDHVKKELHERLKTTTFTSEREMLEEEAKPLATEFLIERFAKPREVADMQAETDSLLAGLMPDKKELLLRGHKHGELSRMAKERGVTPQALRQQRQRLLKRLHLPPDF